MQKNVFISALKTWKTEVFLGIISACVLLFGESIWRPAIFTIGLLFAIVARKHLNWWSFVSRPVLWVVMVFWLLSQMISTFFSVHVPASLQAVLLPIMSILGMWFFLGVQRQWLWRQRVVYVLSWVVGIFGILQLIGLFWLSSITAEYLPRLNYLYAHHGHNHISAFIVLLLPFTWTQIVRPGSTRYRLPTWLGIWHVLVLALAFSRLALALGVVQLLVVGYYHRHILSKLHQQIFISLALFLLVFAVFKQVMSTSGFEQLLCEQKLLTSEYCLEQRHELRWLYWEQAWLVFKESRIWGTGPGTFGYVGRQFLQEHGANSAFVHNWALSALAETGLVGFVATFCFMLTTCVLLYKQQRTTWRFMSILSVLSFWFIASFDFDNQLLAVWSLVLCIIGLSLRQPRLPTLPSQVSLRAKVIFSFQLGLGFLAVLYACFQLVLVSITQFGIWPSILHHLPVVVVVPQQITAQTLPALQPSLKKWYLSDPDVVFQMALFVADDQRQSYYQRVALLDPWKGMLSNQLAQTTELEISTAESWAEYYWNFYHQLWLRGNTVSAEVSFDMSDSLYILAKRFFMQGEYEKSALWLVRAQKIEPWVLSRNQPFINLDNATGEMWRFAKPFVGFPRTAFGDQQAHYTQVFNLVFLKATQSASTSLDTAVQKVLNASKIERAQKESEYQKFITQLGEEVMQIATLAYRVLPTEAERSPEMVDRVTEVCLKIANYSVGHGTKKVPQLYAVAIRLRPWLMNGKTWWFELAEHQDKKEDSIDFIEYWQTWEKDWIGYNPEAFMWLLERGIAFSTSEIYIPRKHKYQYIYQQLSLQKEASEKNKP